MKRLWGSACITLVLLAQWQDMADVQDGLATITQVPQIAERCTDL